jgi:predicted RNase H-like HicB family nuclease
MVSRSRSEMASILMTSASRMLNVFDASKLAAVRATSLAPVARLKRMNKRTLEVDVHREPPGYWAQVCELDGCFASGTTFDELLEALNEAIALYAGDDEPDRILTRVTTLRLEVEPDLRPADAEQVKVTGPPPRRKRQAHRDDWPPRAGS